MLAAASSFPVVRMPLQTEDRQGLVFVTFHIPLFFIPLGSYKVFSQPFHILMMAVDHCLGFPETVIEPGILFDPDGPLFAAQMIMLAADTLGQSTAQSYIDQLASPADPQDRLAGLFKFSHCINLDPVIFFFTKIGMAVCLFCIVKSRIQSDICN